MQPGDIIEGRFAVLREVAVGGMGRILQARDVSTGSIVALKLIASDDPSFTERFVREAVVLADIKHPGVVQVSDVGTATDGSLFLVMELLEGHTLSQRMQQSGGRLSEDETLTICWQLAGVLSAAHAKNIVHRDHGRKNKICSPLGHKATYRQRTDYADAGLPLS